MSLSRPTAGACTRVLRLSASARASAPTPPSTLRGSSLPPPLSSPSLRLALLLSAPTGRLTEALPSTLLPPFSAQSSLSRPRLGFRCE
eukprot:220393-Rhodomonas_salina.1